MKKLIQMKVGDKVVCIDDKDPSDPTRIMHQMVKRGEIYTVRGFSSPPSGDTGVLLEEITNGLWSNGSEGSYNPNRFRPIDYTFGEKVCEKIEKQLQPELV